MFNSSFLGYYLACSVYWPTFRNNLLVPSSESSHDPKDGKTGRSKTSDNKHYMPGNNLKIRIKHSHHGEDFKSLYGYLFINVTNANPFSCLLL